MATALAPRQDARIKEQLYVWEGVDRSNKPMRGETRGASETVVTTNLRRQGIRITKIKRQTYRGGRRINDKAGLTFATALRSFLRQDPDIIMVGEIRDLETADIAIKAAQTGHLVLSTVHTNDAPTTLTRLLNMGVAPFNVASSVILITAQRLARKLCLQCKKPTDIPPEALLRAGFKSDDLDGSWQPFAPIGCDNCKGTGYRGRTGIYEVMPISDDMRQLIMRNGNALDIAAQARKEGLRTLRESGLLKVKAGATSLEEIEAVTNE